MKLFTDGTIAALQILSHLLNLSGPSNYLCPQLCKHSEVIFSDIDI